jgi:hypothetical protein
MHAYAHANLLHPPSPSCPLQCDAPDDKASVSLVASAQRLLQGQLLSGKQTWPQDGQEVISVILQRVSGKAGVGSARELWKHAQKS